MSELAKLEDHVAGAVAGVRQLREANDTLSQENARLRTSLAMETSRNDQLGALLSHAESLRDYYQRRVAQLECALDMASGAINHAISQAQEPTQYGPRESASPRRNERANEIVDDGLRQIAAKFGAGHGTVEEPANGA
jgi:hypothetical protein